MDGGINIRKYTLPVLKMSVEWAQNIQLFSYLKTEHSDYILRKLIYDKLHSKFLIYVIIVNNRDTSLIEVASIENVETLEDDHNDDQEISLCDNIDLEKQSTKMSSGGSKVTLVNKTISILLKNAENKNNGKGW